MENNLSFQLISNDFEAFYWGKPLERECIIGNNKEYIKFRDIVNDLDRKVNSCKVSDRERIENLRKVLNKVEEFDAKTEHKGVIEGILGVVSRVFGDNSKLHSIEKKLAKLESKLKKHDEREQIYNKEWNLTGKVELGTSEQNFIPTFQQHVKALKYEFAQLKNEDSLRRKEKLKGKIDEAIKYDKEERKSMLKIFSKAHRELNALNDEFKKYSTKNEYYERYDGEKNL